MMTKNWWSNLFIFFFFCLLTFLLFLPVFSKPFVSDDYAVLYRLIIQKEFFIKGFFRPLSDLTIYFCYLMGGLRVEFYNSFNLLIHAANCYLLYRFCIVSSLFRSDVKKFIAWAASILFLIYPFHTESVVWMVGRASSLSNFFGFLSLLVAVSRVQRNRKYFLVCLFYFLGLASYETIMPLPAIILIMIYLPEKPLMQHISFVILLFLTLVLHLVIRYEIGGSMTGEYGQKIFSPSLSVYATNLFKVTGRLLLPPSENSALLTALFCLLILLFFCLSFQLLKDAKEDQFVFFKLLAAFTISCIIPVMFGVSTRTEEGNRVIYFTSFFLIILIAFLLSLLKRKKHKFWASFFLLFYFLFFLYQSNLSWSTAGVITSQLIRKIKETETGTTTIGLINIPEEYKGAFIFRVGFSEALIMNGIDTSKVKLLRTMSTEEGNKLEDTISIKEHGDSVYIAPNTLIIEDNLIIIVHPYSFDTIAVNRGNFGKLMFWNKKNLETIK